MCPFEAFLPGVVPSVVGVVVMISGTALGTALVQVIQACPVPVFITRIPVLCVVCA